ncbi:hypothetical protein, partial [Stutzerimonas nosocomialis]|uniref:hypothetical protein n=1 Tax=Stutzerimonas nosocomialis TaxID=1056496 RepID=UPI0019D58C98
HSASLPYNSFGGRNMKEEGIFFVAKFLEKKYLEEFLCGRLHLSAAQYFRNLEDKENPGRPDRFECVDHMWQSDQVAVLINGHEVGGITGPILATQERFPCYIFCLTAVTTRWVTERPQRLDARLAKFGEVCVTIEGDQIKKFFDRIKTAIDSSSNLYAIDGSNGRCAGLVDYVDKSFHGAIGPFRKLAHLSYQKEWRIAVMDTKSSPEPFIKLDIGDIRNICNIWDTSVILSSDIKAVRRV